MSHKLSESELVDAEIKARESISSQKDYVLRERAISGVEQRRLVAGLKKDLERLKQTKEYKAIWRSRIVGRLYAWGEWATSSGASTAAGSTPLGNAVKRAELSQIANEAAGYERGLSDYESLMITIDGHVSALCIADQDLIILEYQVMTNGVAEYWESTYGKTPGRYRRRKSELLKILSSKIND